MKDNMPRTTDNIQQAESVLFEIIETFPNVNGQEAYNYLVNNGIPKKHAIEAIKKHGTEHTAEQALYRFINENPNGSTKEALAFMEEFGIPKKDAEEVIGKYGVVEDAKNTIGNYLKFGNEKITSMPQKPTQKQIDKIKEPGQEAVCGDCDGDGANDRGEKCDNCNGTGKIGTESYDLKVKEGLTPEQFNEWVDLIKIVKNPGKQLEVDGDMKKKLDDLNTRADLEDKQKIEKMGISTRPYEVPSTESDEPVDTNDPKYKKFIKDEDKRRDEDQKIMDKTPSKRSFATSESKYYPKKVQEFAQQIRKDTTRADDTALRLKADGDANFYGNMPGNMNSVRFTDHKKSSTSNVPGEAKGSEDLHSEKCTCGHHRANHLDTDNEEGHGACQVPQCPCEQYTFKSMEAIENEETCKSCGASLGGRNTCSACGADQGGKKNPEIETDEAKESVCPKKMAEEKRFNEIKESMSNYITNKGPVTFSDLYERFGDDMSIREVRAVIKSLENIHEIQKKGKTFEAVQYSMRDLARKPWSKLTESVRNKMVKHGVTESVWNAVRKDERKKQVRELTRETLKTVELFTKTLNHMKSAKEKKKVITKLNENKQRTSIKEVMALDWDQIPSNTQESFKSIGVDKKLWEAVRSGYVAQESITHPGIKSIMELEWDVLPVDAQETLRRMGVTGKTWESVRVIGEGVDEEKVFSYLDDVRASGEVNMFGAAPYVEKAFGISRAEARTLLGKWMETFSDRHPKESTEGFDEITDDKKEEHRDDIDVSGTLKGDYNKDSDTITESVKAVEELSDEEAEQKWMSLDEGDRIDAIKSLGWTGQTRTHWAHLPPGLKKDIKNAKWNNTLGEDFDADDVGNDIFDVNDEKNIPDMLKHGTDEKHPGDGAHTMGAGPTEDDKYEDRPVVQGKKVSVVKEGNGPLPQRSSAKTPSEYWDELDNDDRVDSLIETADFNDWGTPPDFKGAYDGIDKMARGSFTSLPRDAQQDIEEYFNKHVTHESYTKEARYLVQILDKETGTVLEEIPADHIYDAATLKTGMTRNLDSSDYEIKLVSVPVEEEPEIVADEEPYEGDTPAEPEEVTATEPNDDGMEEVPEPEMPLDEEPIGEDDNAEKKESLADKLQRVLDSGEYSDVEPTITQPGEVEPEPIATPDSAGLSKETCDDCGITFSSTEDLEEHKVLDHSTPVGEPVEVPEEKMEFDMSELEGGLDLNGDEPEHKDLEVPSTTEEPSE